MNFMSYVDFGVCRRISPCRGKCRVLSVSSNPPYKSLPLAGAGSGQTLKIGLSNVLSGGRFCSCALLVVQLPVGDGAQ